MTATLRRSKLTHILRAAKPRHQSPALKSATLRIEAMRPELEADETPTGWEHAPTIGKLATIASVRPEKASLLFAAVETWQPTRILEMGTCCGVSGAYMQLASSAAFRSLELSPVAATTALNLWAALELKGEVVVGDFADTFEAALDPAPDLAFVDGNHHEAPTWSYFERLTAASPAGSLLIFDDVDWSDGMKRVWARIKADSRVASSIVASRMGFAVL